MSEIDRVIGKLEESTKAQKESFDDFKKETAENFKQVNQKIDNLNAFKIRVSAYAVAAFMGGKLIWELVSKALANSGH